MKELRIVLAGRPALSTPGARLACIISPLRDAAHAETEARIIIAANTPTSRDTLDLPLRVVAQMSERGAALAEALPSFIDTLSALESEALAAFVGEE